MRDEANNISVLGFGASYTRDLTVILNIVLDIRYADTDINADDVDTDWPLAFHR